MRPDPDRDAPVDFDGAGVINGAAGLLSLSFPQPLSLILVKLLLLLLIILLIIPGGVVDTVMKLSGAAGATEVVFAGRTVET